MTRLILCKHSTSMIGCSCYQGHALLKVKPCKQQALLFVCRPSGFGFDACSWVNCITWIFRNYNAFALVLASVLALCVYHHCDKCTHNDNVHIHLQLQLAWLDKVNGNSQWINIKKHFSYWFRMTLHAALTRFCSALSMMNLFVWVKNQWSLSPTRQICKGYYYYYHPLLQILE